MSGGLYRKLFRSKLLFWKEYVGNVKTCGDGFDKPIEEIN
jgi:hypothetical protein